MKSVLSLVAFFVLAFSFSLPAAATALHCELDPDSADTSHGQIDSVITRLYVSKKNRVLFALSQDHILKAYHIALGLHSDVGPKHFQDDFKTPEGRYFLTDMNEASAYHLAFHVSYPDASDIAYAKANGQNPGGQIELHGFPSPALPDYAAADEPYSSLLERAQKTHQTSADWTAGCIGVTSDEIDELATQLRPAMQKGENVPIDLCP